ncbi:DUF6916 family protein [Gynuella sunshinyii]|uniref:DUF6916 domain-containing protein n=1 Tax=Gynuella sunshinyii YC6258 TaxID=1445510 RepID=A0A0C5VGL7_9GAMM|nr:hypothetical protein [Gynuella sunshinyii]AJQ93336.1 hypothetical Protein YC6258_01288 [Gynuella sunshinyii YC6258]
MQDFNYQNLSPLVGQTVEVSDPENNQKLTQLTIKGVSLKAPNGEEYEAFSVLLKGDEDFHLPQNNYSFAVPGLGEQTLFMSPNSLDEYEIVICRSRQSKTSS